MSSPLQARRAEEKFGLILRRADSIRARLNLLVWQRAAFGILAWVIAASALAVLAALYLSPLAFLGTTLALGACVAAGLFDAARTAWRRHVDLERAAAVADRRAELKGRLETVVQIGREQRTKTGPMPALWSYLLEDTIAHQQEFEPARIERRRVSRSLYAMLGSVALAALAMFLLARARRAEPAAGAAHGQVTLRLKDLHLRRAEPGSDYGLELEADAATMRRLQSEMAAGQGNAGSSHPLDRLMNRARALARNLQNRLTGRSRARLRLKLKLADASNEGAAPQDRAGGTPKAPSQGGNSTAASPTEPSSPKQAAQAPASSINGMGKNAAVPPANNRHPGNVASAGNTHPAGGGANTRLGAGDQHNRNQANNGAGGASHGNGVAPNTLFGARSKPELGSSEFKVAIQARPMPPSHRGGHAYVPPKVQVPLNGEQHPDEPIMRAVIPEQDRDAIKRVFER